MTMPVGNTVPTTEQMLMAASQQRQQTQGQAIAAQMPAVEQAIDKNIAMATPNLGPIDTSKLAGQPPQDTFVPSKAATAPQA